MTEYKYTQSCCWFPGSEINLKMETFVEKSKENKILEIGCFEGLSSVFLADNFINHSNSSLTCVDPYTIINNDDHGQFFINNHVAEDNFDFNVSVCKNSDKIIIHKTTSDLFFEKNNKTYNFIYIDGCHETDFIERDMENAFRVLESNGVMWMDDYEGGCGGAIKKTMDTFLKKYESQFDLIHIGYQLAIQKH